MGKQRLPKFQACLFAKNRGNKKITNYTRRNLCGKIIGRGFDSLHLHQKNEITASAVVLFFLNLIGGVEKDVPNGSEAKIVQRTIFRTRLADSLHLHHFITTCEL